LLGLQTIEWKRPEFRKLKNSSSTDQDNAVAKKKKKNSQENANLFLFHSWAAQKKCLLPDRGRRILETSCVLCDYFHASQQVSIPP
jgi:hypothetical protein